MTFTAGAGFGLSVRANGLLLANGLERAASEGAAARADGRAAGAAISAAERASSSSHASPLSRPSVGAAVNAPNGGATSLSNCDGR
eukprot:3504688-Prymnesium_polylepis.1